MTITIPNIFANKVGAAQLSELDENFSLVANTTNDLSNSITSLSSDVSSLSSNVDIISANLDSFTANVALSSWSLSEVDNTLYFYYNGSPKMTLSPSGDLTVTGNVTAFATLGE